MKAGRHHADHCVTLTIEPNLLTEYLEIGSETALPQAVAYHHNVGVARAILFRGKVAAQAWMDPQRAYARQMKLRTFDTLSVDLGTFR